MQVKGLTIDGRGSQTLAPAAEADLVRLQDLQSALSGVAPLEHTHVAADITDLAEAVAEIGSGLWGLGSGVAHPALNGGLIEDETGLRVDSGIVSMAGHEHSSGDIMDLVAAIFEQLTADLVSTPSLAWFSDGSQLSGVVQTKAGGALISDTGGLSVNLGTGHTQAAYGDHTHAQLHDAVTLNNGSTVLLSLAGQVLTAEVVAAPAEGLTLTSSGLAVDFGSGHTQVLRGDALTNLSLSGVNAVVNTPTLQLSISGNILSGVVVLDPAPPGGTGGLIEAGTSGLRVKLGTTSTTAAAGDHTHAAATELADGLMSAADKAKLDVLVGMEVEDTSTLTLTLEPQVLSGVATPILSGEVILDAAPAAGYGQVATGPSGLRVVLGTAADTAAAGDHTHDVATELTAGFMSAADKRTLDTLVMSGVTPALKCPDNLYRRLAIVQDPGGIWVVTVLDQTGTATP